MRVEKNPVPEENQFTFVQEQTNFLTIGYTFQWDLILENERQNDLWANLTQASYQDSHLVYEGNAPE